mgnify:CR=1 FL=1
MNKRLGTVTARIATTNHEVALQGSRYVSSYFYDGTYSLETRFEHPRVGSPWELIKKEYKSRNELDKALDDLSNHSGYCTNHSMGIWQIGGIV